MALEDRDYMRAEGPGGSYDYGGRLLYGGGKSMIGPVIIANIVMFVLQNLSGKVQLPGTIAHIDKLTLELSLYVPALKHGEVWRLASYMFLHGGFWHIMLNMYALFLFGKPVERMIGCSRFLILYFISGIVAVVCWLPFNWERVPPLPLIGASGAVFGVMMAAAMLFPNQRILLLFPPIPMKMKTFVGVYAIIEIVMHLSDSKEDGGGIAHLAHLGGLFGGFLVMWYFRSSRPGGQPTTGGLSAAFRRLFASFSKPRKSQTQRPKSSGYPPDLAFDEPEDSENLVISQIDPILDKIGNHGMQSLTPKEKAILDHARKKLKER